MGVWAHGLIGS
jgi:hypothetical protein